MSCCLRCCTCKKRHAVWNTGGTARGELVVLGLEGAGKSLLMRQLCNLANGTQKNIQQLQPTVGVQLYKLTAGSKHCSHTAYARCACYAVTTCHRPPSLISTSGRVLEHVLGMESLQTALKGLLTVINVSLEDGDGLQELLQWVKTHKRR
ncbi:hypothetical protein ABBQ32_001498 [Trebouxia sp. C0010 RCD-2024]